MPMHVQARSIEKDMEKGFLALDAQIVRESVRTRDKNGYLQVKTSRLTQDQVAPYYGREIPGWEERKLDPERIYYGWRNPDELKAALTTFNGVPLLIEHKFDSAQRPNKELRIGMVGTSAKWEPPYITNALSVWDEQAIEAIEDGSLRDLSCGYRYTPDFTAGKTPDGVEYDFVMRDIACNHVALVNDGRAPDCYVEDSNPEGMSTMPGIENKGALDGFAEFARKVIENAQTGLSPEAIEALAKQFAEAYSSLEQQKEESAPTPPAEDEEPDDAGEAPAQEGGEDESEEPPAATDGDECGAEDEDEGAKDEDEKEGAMDAALIAKKVRQQLSAQYQAANQCRGVLGNVDALAYDSADAIYADALKSMGIKGTPLASAKYVFTALQTVKSKTEGAQDSALKTNKSDEDFLKKFVR